MKKILLILALTTLATTAALAQVPSSRGGSRDRVPALAAEDFKMDSLKGRVVLMAFWKTPDEASARMLPWLSRLQEDFGNDGLTVVAVNVDQKSSIASEAVSALHPRIQVVLDPTGRMVMKQELSQVPGGVFFDREGVRVYDFVGFKNEDIELLTPVVEAMVAEGEVEAEAEEKEKK